MSITRSSIGTATRTVFASFSKSKAPSVDVTRQIDGAKIAHRRLRRRSHLGNLRAEIRQMHHIAGRAGLIALEIAGIFEDHPAIAGLGQRAHHARVEIARLHLPRIVLLLLRRSRRPRQRPRQRDRADAAHPSDRRATTRHPASTRRIKRSGIQLARFRL